MKRRTFLTASGTVGIFTAVPGASIIYSSTNSNLLLEEFSTSTRDLLDKFMSEVTLNLQTLGLDEKLAKRIVSPTRIINRKLNRIRYKNNSGDYIALSVDKGVDRIYIQKSL